jgi:glycosyltransferase involved in cell wall biosynthesis
MLDLAINGRFLAQPTTGVQRVAREITREIDAILCEQDAPAKVRLICQENASTEGLTLRRIQVHRTGRLPGHAWEQLTLPMAVGKSRLLCLGNTAPVVSLLGPRPVAVMIHDLSFRLFPEAYTRTYRLGHSLLMPLMLKRARPILTVSDSEKLMLATLVRDAAPRIVVAQNGGWREGEAALDPALLNLTGLPEPGYVLYVGAFTQRKNLPRILDVAIKIARDFGQRTVLVGASASIHTPIAVDLPPDVADKITFLGHIEDTARLGEIYRRARCLLFPSFYEASPIPPLEAMHFDCPVIGSDIPSIRERCGDAAEYCDPSDANSILLAVTRLLTDPKRVQHLVERGRERIQLFSWRTQAQKVLDAIRDDGGD